MDRDPITFNKKIGMPADGFEIQILVFMRGMKAKGHQKEKVRKSAMAQGDQKTKFEREIKRLECSVNYDGKWNKGESTGVGQKLLLEY